MGKPLSPTERTRLVGILGMLGSDHLGERAAAAALASRLVRSAGLGWDDVVAAGPAPQQQAPGGSQDGPASRWADSDTLATCLRWLGQLTTWEVGFVVDLRTKRRPLTAGQRAKLEQIAASLRARGYA